MFEQPRLVNQFMQGFSAPWYVAGGWAVDLFVGYPTRPHHDIEIVVLRRDQLAIQSFLADWSVEYVQSGERFAWEQGDWLDSPIHEIHATRSGDGLTELEVLMNESEEHLWRFRRNLYVERPLNMLGLYSAEGIPYLAPEIALLYKAKQPRETDYADFEQVNARLNDEQRGWLRTALQQTHPDHLWLSLL